LLQKDVVNKLLAKHKQTKAAATVLTALIDEPHGYGRIIRDVAGNIVAIREQKDATPAEDMINEINVGMYCFESKKLFAALKKIKLNPNKKEFYLTDVVELLLANGERVATVVTDDESVAFGVNTRADLAQAEGIIRKRILSKLMEDGVTIIDPATTYVEAGAKIGEDSIIYPCSYIHSDVTIGKNCKIGPFARIRPGSKIGDGAEIGNFTEVSRSNIGSNVTMKHFSFLGDATVGSETNIGAGTVTANYDGKNKNKTVIGDGAFIGSDSILVAPVTIGKKAMTGAGTVVKSGTNIPAGKTAVGVPARIIK
jgi:bifunctional UDP-N-acetylglucosamine pyrophosphorylase / glucosamine-1-phosphate N-acetyltransferase